MSLFCPTAQTAFGSLAKTRYFTNTWLLCMGLFFEFWLSTVGQVRNFLLTAALSAHD